MLLNQQGHFGKKKQITVLSPCFTEISLITDHFSTWTDKSLVAIVSCGEVGRGGLDSLGHHPDGIAHTHTHTHVCVCVSCDGDEHFNCKVTAKRKTFMSNMVMSLLKHRAEGRN